MARVLIVDDEATVRVTLQLLLEMEDHDCTLASDGAEALDRLRWEKFDLIVLDDLMPTMSGTELSQSLRSQGDLTPIVFMSGEERAKENLRRCAPTVVLSKPFGVRELLVAVDDLTEGRNRALLSSKGSMQLH
jgi:DNA-binding response OmpR family regulator